MSANSAYKQWKINHQKQDKTIEHREGCKFIDTYTPMNECLCDCYELSIFRSGYFAAKGTRDV